MRSAGVIVLCFLLSGCSRYILIERSERFVNSKEFGQKIICIDPQVRWVGDVRKDHDEAVELENFLKEELNYSSNRNGIELEILELNSSASPRYYQSLLSLKKEVLQANNYQDTPLNFRRAPGYNSIKKSVFIYPPLLAHDFTSLSQEYGTPYFSYMGFYVRNGSILFYHLIVNTNTAETVYRELKAIPKSRLKKKYIAQMVYDSMAMLKKELK